MTTSTALKEKKLLNVRVGETISLDFEKNNSQQYHINNDFVSVKKITPQYVLIKKANGELEYFIKNKHKETKVLVQK